MVLAATATKITQNVIDTFLEPLCKATEQTLREMPIGPRDYLLIDLNDDGSKFLVQAQSFRLADSYDKENWPDRLWTINGEIMVKTDNPSWNASHGFAKKIPERKEAGYGRYLFATTDFTALVIHHAWPKDRLVFKSDEAQVQYRFLLARFFSQTRSAELTAQFKVDGTLPVMPNDYIPHPKYPLAPFQELGLLVSMNQPAKALFMEQGTGKSAIGVSRVNIEAKRKRDSGQGMYRALVICPGNVRINWEREFQKFSVHSGKTGVMRGDIHRRITTLIDVVRDEEDCNWATAIISTDSVSNTWDAIKKVPWDLVILDESHYIKDPKSKRSKACRNFNETRTRQRMALTGTPIANVVFDLWAQFEYLGEGLSGFSTFANFRGFHGKFKHVKDKGLTPKQKLIGIKALPLLQERLARVAYMITKEEAALQLPDKVYDLSEAEMTKIQAEFYNTLASKLVLEIEQILDEDASKVTADHILTKLLRLAQITSGFYKTDTTVDPDTGEEVEGVVRQIPGRNPKIEATVAMLQDEGKDIRGKTIIWACFKEDIRALSVALHEAGIKHTGYHAEILREYREVDAHTASDVMNNDYDCEVFIGNPASAREGLNILGYNPEQPERSDRYVDHVIYFSCNWSMIHRAQSEDRAHRRGTRCNVRITDLVIPGTIDEEIRARVLEKKATSLLIQDVKEILHRMVTNLKGAA